MEDQTYLSRDQAAMRADLEQAIATAILFTIAMGLGAALALLFVQNSGQETRDQIARMINPNADTRHDPLRRLEKEYGNLRKKVEEVLQSGG